MGLTRHLSVFLRVVFLVRHKVRAHTVLTLTGDTFFPQYVGFFKALDVINFVSLTFVVLYCLLWIAILYQSPKFRVRSRYVIGTAVALVLWHTPGFITLVAKPKNVLCSNPITRATEATHLCALEGNCPIIWAERRLSLCIFLTCCRSVT